MAPIIDIIFTACLLATPTKCETVRMAQEDYRTPYACAMKAQALVAEYLKDHPQWFVQRYGCGVKSKDA